MDDRVYCKDCVSMPSKNANGEYKTWKGRCQAGDPFWSPELKMRCPSFRQKIFLDDEDDGNFWE
jgi:hypothetical protein